MTFKWCSWASFNHQLTTKGLLLWNNRSSSVVMPDCVYVLLKALTIIETCDFSVCVYAGCLNAGWEPIYFKCWTLFLILFIESQQFPASRMWWNYCLLMSLSLLCRVKLDKLLSCKVGCIFTGETLELLLCVQITSGILQILRHIFEA